MVWAWGYRDYYNGFRGLGLWVLGLGYRDYYKGLLKEHFMALVQS